MGREERRLVFVDTERMCKEHPVLKETVASAINKQELVLEGQVVEVDQAARFKQKAEVLVSKKRTYEAASAYKDTGDRVLVHNFASATNPGGGVVKGSSAQEEALCRCSTLYFNLNTKEMWDGFYGPHRAEGDPIHNDDCIYTPDVMVFKTDTDNPVCMKEEDWYKVDVITCAAPNLRLKPSNSMNPNDGTAKKLTDVELLALHEKRMRRILDIAKFHKADVVILGAFGCGAFQNPPAIVARAMKNVVQDYLYDFKTIEFAVYCSPNDQANYEIFSRNIKI